MQPLLEVSGLKKHFPIFKGVFARPTGQVYAVDGISFHIERGETLGLVGESGCGKSTLGRTLLKPRRRADAAIPAADANDLPGPLRVAEPADVGR
jgi:ABC-type oligopeptide transport system ATPase subunit